MRRLVLAEPAERDLDSIVDYITPDNPAAAESVFRAIIATAERLRQFPEMGRIGRLPGTREFPVASLPYIVVYEVLDDVVTIIAVFHGARDLARALAERQRERDKLKPG